MSESMGKRAQGRAELDAQQSGSRVQQHMSKASHTQSPASKLMCCQTAAATAGQNLQDWQTQAAEPPLAVACLAPAHGAAAVGQCPNCLPARCLPRPPNCCCLADLVCGRPACVLAALATADPWHPRLLLWRLGQRPLPWMPRPQALPPRLPPARPLPLLQRPLTRWPPMTASAGCTAGGRRHGQRHSRHLPHGCPRGCPGSCCPCCGNCHQL